MDEKFIGPKSSRNPWYLSTICGWKHLNFRVVRNISTYCAMHMRSTTSCANARLPCEHHLAKGCMDKTKNICPFCICNFIFAPNAIFKRNWSHSHCKVQVTFSPPEQKSRTVEFSSIHNTSIHEPQLSRAGSVPKWDDRISVTILYRWSPRCVLKRRSPRQHDTNVRLERSWKRRGPPRAPSRPGLRCWYCQAATAAVVVTAWAPTPQPQLSRSEMLSHSADGLKVWFFCKVSAKYVNVTVCQALCFKFGLRLRWMWAEAVLVQQSRLSRAGPANPGPPLSRSRLGRSWLPPGRPQCRTAHAAGAAIAAGASRPAWQGLLGSESLPMPYAVCGE